MSVLLLRLAGPLQAWGDSSRFTRRETRREPTKSGVVGLLAAALGRSREADVSDLAALDLAVRSDQPGTVIRDFQTERPVKGDPMPLTHRYYLADAKFLVALGGDRDFLEEIDQAIKHPVWPLYLGRRSCPPDLPVSCGVHDEYVDVRDAMAHEAWIASPWYRRRFGADCLSELEVTCDAREGELAEYCPDYPLSFAAAGRAYTDRAVFRFRVPNPDGACGRATDAADAVGAQAARPDHDPMSCL